MYRDANEPRSSGGGGSKKARGIPSDTKFLQKLSPENYVAPCNTPVKKGFFKELHLTCVIFIKNDSFRIIFGELLVFDRE